jgi:hypothetical protein
MSWQSTLCEPNKGHLHRQDPNLQPVDRQVGECDFQTYSSSEQHVSCVSTSAHLAFAETFVHFSWASRLVGCHAAGELGFLPLSGVLMHS